jgi:hypothetical protein
VVAGTNFHIAEKPTEKSDHRVIEHIDELLDILNEARPNDSTDDSEEKEKKKERIVRLIHKNDNLEAIVWQLYHAGFTKPGIKYGAGKLAWVSLMAIDTVFIIKSQQIVDWAIDGMMEVDDANTFNRMHDAKTEFYHQLFKMEHRSYYSNQDLEILNECRTVANLGWLKKLEKQAFSRSRHHRPEAIPRSSLAEIDISKAYTGAFMRIKAVPVFNEFDVWEPYKRGQRIRNLSLYLVEASEFDLFFNKRYNLCYGHFLKQVRQQHIVLGVKHPSLVKKVNYQQLVEELWKTQISEDFEEDQILKKTVANCNYGMLEKQINRVQKSKLFDTYEDARFFQAKYGGTITFIQEYEEKRTWKEENILDQDVEDAEASFQNRTRRNRRERRRLS